MLIESQLVDGGIQTLVLNDPERRNALSRSMITELSDRLAAGDIPILVDVREYHEIEIAEAEARLDGRGDSSDALPVRVPDYMTEIVARITMEARKAPEISQSSGVSVRVTINNLETLIANAEKRALRCGEQEVVPRVTDLPALTASTRGKLEFEYGLEAGGELEVVERLVSRAVKAAFDERCNSIDAGPIVDYINELY